jgi:hypothetical protein
LSAKRKKKKRRNKGELAVISPTRENEDEKKQWNRKR